MLNSTLSAKCGVNHAAVSKNHLEAQGRWTNAGGCQISILSACKSQAELESGLNEVQLYCGPQVQYFAYMHTAALSSCVSSLLSTFWLFQAFLG